MPDSPAPPPAEDPKASVLAAIDWELGVLGSRQTILGTTAWTLAAALAGTFWLLFSRQHPWSELPMLCLLVLGLSLAYEPISGLFYSIADPTQGAPVSGVLFSLSERFGHFRGLLTSQIVITTGLFLCLVAARGEISRPLFFVLVAYFVGRLLILVAVSALARWSALVEKKDDEKAQWAAMSVLRKVAAVVFLLLLQLGPLVWFWTEFLMARPTISVETFRSAALVCVARALVEFLLVGQMPTTLIATLQGLRRGLALDLLTPMDARAQLRIALIGARKDELLQEKLAELIAAYRPVISVLEDSIRSLERQREDLASRTDWSPEEIASKKTVFATDFDAHGAQIREAFDKLRQTDFAIGKRILIRYGPTVGGELAKAGRQYFDELKARVTDRDALARVIGAELSKPRTAPRPEAPPEDGDR